MIAGLAPVGAQIRLRVECKQVSVGDVAAVLRAFAAVASEAYRDGLRRRRVRGRSRADVTVTSLTIGSPLDLVVDLALPPVLASLVGPEQWRGLVADVLQMLFATVEDHVLRRNRYSMGGDALAVAGERRNYLTVYRSDFFIEAPVEVFQDDRTIANVIRLVDAIGRVDGAGSLGAANDLRFPPLS